MVRFDLDNSWCSAQLELLIDSLDGCGAAVFNEHDVHVSFLRPVVAFRQRRGYFSTARRAKQRAAKLAIKAARRARVADPDEGWADGTLEPVHQANPIELQLAAHEPSGGEKGEGESSA